MFLGAKEKMSVMEKETNFGNLDWYHYDTVYANHESKLRTIKNCVYACVFMKMSLYEE